MIAAAALCQAPLAYPDYLAIDAYPSGGAAVIRDRRVLAAGMPPL